MSLIFITYKGNTDTKHHELQFSDGNWEKKLNITFAPNSKKKS